MKHRSWIKNYERNFEQLAKEIGDLRYDTLAEFLRLLSQKIEQDGQQDRSRGRTQLADSLQRAAANLEESAESIELAWRISEPFMYPPDIIQKIRQEFVDRDKVREALKLISAYSLNWDGTESFRLIRCLLHGTHGNLQQLRKNIDLARMDWRDLIIQAEYEGGAQQLRNYNHPFGEAEMLPDDPI